MTWWMWLVIITAGLGSGVLLARVERVRITDDSKQAAPPSDDRPPVERSPVD